MPTLQVLGASGTPSDDQKCFLQHFQMLPRTGGGTHHLQEETTEHPSWFLPWLIFSESRSSLAGAACSEISVGVAYSMKNRNMKAPKRIALKNKWFALKLKSVCQSMDKHTR